MAGESTKIQVSEGSSVIDNAVKLVGETFVPGASLLLHGHVAEGLLHTVLGFTARAVLGPLGYVLVAGNSFSKATTGKNLHEHAGLGSSD